MLHLSAQHVSVVPHIAGVHLSVSLCLSLSLSVSLCLTVSLQACTAALATATCLPCASGCNGTGSPLACPQWTECGGSQSSTLYTTTGSMGPNSSVLLSAGVTLTSTESQILPAVLRNDIGAVRLTCP